MTPEEQAALDAEQEKQIRDLATQITQMSRLGFDPMTIRKGIIAAVNDTSSPPTVAINISGDETTLVSQVRTLNNYTPLVGQTVLVAKQGAEIFLLGAIAATNPTGVNTATDNGWNRATLTAGSHGGNSNGDIYYRRVMDHGSWKMQWRGGWNVSGTTVITGLDPDYCPSSLRSVPAARNASGLVVMAKLDFASDGSVTLAGGTLTGTTTTEGGQSTSGASPGTSSHGGHAHGIDWDGSVYNANHNHFGATFSGGSHNHTVDNHWHGNGNHNHDLSVTAPTWVSFNGVEYFL